MSHGKVRVLHVIDKLGVGGSSIHGVTRALSWWLPRMDRSRFEFSICSLREPESAARFFEDENLRVRFLNRRKFDPRTVWDLLSIIRQSEPDILHLHGYGSTNFGRIAGALLGIPRIVHEHVVLEDQPGYQTLVDAILSPLTSQAIAISPPVRNFMVERRRINPRKIETFFYGIPLQEFTPSEESVIKRKRRNLGLRLEQPVVCCVGRIDTQKGQRYLISAAGIVTEELPDAAFLIVGDGPELGQRKKQRERLGLADVVFFLGHRDDIPDLLAMSDVVALPSLFEGGPITLFEAMRVGKPVVGTPVGLMPDVIEDGRTGYLVPPKEVEPLASRLVDLLKKPDRAEQMGMSAREAVKEYDMSEAVKRLTRIYREVASVRA